MLQRVSIHPRNRLAGEIQKMDEHYKVIHP